MNQTINFRKTLSELKRYLELPVLNNRDRAGIIQAFEFTFEQCWKTLQKVAGSQGIQIGNPKAAFKYAMANGWIPSSEETQWLELLKDRNLTSHTYEELLARQVLERIQNFYVGMFEALLSAIDRETLG